MKSIPPPPSSTTVTPNPPDTGCQSDDSRPRDGSATTEADVEAVGGEDPRTDCVPGDEVGSVGHLKPGTAAPPPIVARPLNTVVTPTPPVVVPLEPVTGGPPLVGSLKSATTTPSSVVPVSIPAVKASKSQSEANKGKEEKEKLVEDLAASIQATDAFATDAGGPSVSLA